jgi:hypothetical protein
MKIDSRSSPYIADEKGAVEEDMQDIVVIDGFEVLGYFGEGREEHSGENAPADLEEIELKAADIPDFITIEEAKIVG